MATETVHERTPAQYEAIKNTMHDQSDVLWDVIALLEAARDKPFNNQGESGERLIRQAMEKIAGVQTAFNPFI